jgi:hypothetical protein
MRIAIVVTGGLHPSGREQVVPLWIWLFSHRATGKRKRPIEALLNVGLAPLAECLKVHTSSHRHRTIARFEATVDEALRAQASSPKPLVFD